MGRSLDKQAEELYRTFSELVRRYQYRDRESVSCHGVSVSQCYALTTISEAGSCTMGELAAALHLDVSTVTRVLDQLVAKRLVRRAQDPDDRRVWRAFLSPKGSALLERIHGDYVAEHRAVLSSLPVESREDVLAAVRGLLEAFTARSRD